VASVDVFTSTEKHNYDSRMSTAAFSRDGTSHAPDPRRLGGLDWTQRTEGRLSSRERGRLLAAVALGQWQNVLGRYPQWGAMVDGAGLRIWDLAPANVTEVLHRYPRADFKRQLVKRQLVKRQLVAMMRAEAAAVPQGRFGFLIRCGLPLAVRMAPFNA
jgi:hypothetical protein